MVLIGDVPISPRGIGPRSGREAGTVKGRWYRQIGKGYGKISWGGRNEEIVAHAYTTGAVTSLGNGYGGKNKPRSHSNGPVCGKYEVVGYFMR